MKTLIAILTAVELASLSAMAVYKTNTSGAASTLKSLVESSVGGDVVVQPAGTYNWSSGASINVPVNVAIEGVYNAGTLGGGNQTIILDSTGTNAVFLTLNVQSSGAARLAGITFRSNGGALKDNGTLIVNGPGKIRIHHIHSDFSSGNNYKWLKLGNGAHGVMDNSRITLRQQNAIYAYNGRQGAGDWMGNLEWTLDTKWGSDEFFYVEDCYFDGTDAHIDVGGTETYSGRVCDGFTAAKFVARFNTILSCVQFETHATGHAPDDRGSRATEVYGNLATYVGVYDRNFAMVDYGSGSGISFDNTVGNTYKNAYLMKQTRKNSSTYGQNANPVGWGYSGTQFNGQGSGWDGNQSTYTGYPSIDNVGRGKGDLLVGGFPGKYNARTGGIAWPQQVLEPVYIWNISASPTEQFISNSSGGRINEGTDYHVGLSGPQTSPTSPFNGTSGVGWGTLANRPTTCAPGVAYWATDQGSWNTSSSNPYGVQRNGADGVLYKCNVANQWTLYYEPLTYPHPLRGGAPPADTTPPAINSVAVQLNGVNWHISANENIMYGAGGPGGFTVVNMSGGPVTLTYASGNNSGTFVYTGNRQIVPGETGTLSFTQNGSGIQDQAANLLNNFSGLNIVNGAGSGDLTAPRLLTATIDATGTNWVLAFDENVGFGPGGSGGFLPVLFDGAVGLTFVNGSGTTNLNYRGNRVVKNVEEGTIDYSQPGNGVVDQSNNQLLSFLATNIVNNSAIADPNSPVLQTITIDSTGTNWSILLSEPCQFGAGGNGGFVPSGWSGGAVTLTYSAGTNSNIFVYQGNRAVTNGESGTMTFTQPINGLEDLTVGGGYDLASITNFPVVNNSTAGTDATAPGLLTARVTSDGITWRFDYNESLTNQSATTGHAVTMDGGGCTLTFLYSTANTVFLTGSRTIASTETGTAAYTQPGTGFSDAATNYVATYSGSNVINESTQGLADTTPPTLLSARITSDGLTWRFHYSEIVGFGAGGNGGHTVSMDGGDCTLSYLTGAGANLYYTGSRVVDFDEAGTASFTQTADRVQDTAGNDAASWGPITVMNESGQGSPAVTNVIVIPPTGLFIRPGI